MSKATEIKLVGQSILKQVLRLIEALHDLAKSGKKYPMVINSWEHNYDALTNYFDYA